MSEREVFGDFRSACHNGDLIGAVRCLDEMDGEDAVVAYGYAMNHFQGSHLLAWMAIESLEVLRRASIVSLALDFHNTSSRKHIYALIEDDDLRTLLLELDRYSVRGWSARIAEGERLLSFGIDGVSGSLGGLDPSLVIDRAAKPSPTTALEWSQRSDKKLPTGLLPLLGISRRRSAGEVWWLVCNGPRAGYMARARYSYGHTTADSENIHWRELVTRFFRLLLTQEPNEVLASDPNHETRLAFWEDLIDPGRDVELFRP